MGLVAVARVTFIIDKKGIVRRVQIYLPVKNFHVLIFFSLYVWMTEMDWMLR